MSENEKLNAEFEAHWRQLLDASGTDDDRRELADTCKALCRDLYLAAAKAERGRAVRICLDECKRWRNADSDDYGIAIGAIGAASNILCAIKGIPTVTDEPVHENESVMSEA